MWYKFIKTIGGAGHKVTSYEYLLADEDTPEGAIKVKKALQDFGEKSDGGSRFGYSLKSEKVDVPPPEWIEREIEMARHVISYHNSAIEAEVSKIDFYKHTLSIKYEKSN